MGGRLFWEPARPVLRRGGSNLDDLPFQPLDNGFGARGGAELFEQRLDMELDGVRRDGQAASRRLVAQAVAQRCENLDLARRQYRPAVLGQWSEAALLRVRTAHGQSRDNGAQGGIDLPGGGVRR